MIFGVIFMDYYERMRLRKVIPLDSDLCNIARPSQQQLSNG